MRKFRIAIVAAFAACAAFAAQVSQYAMPADGMEFSSAVGGKIARVQVFSPVASGTVALKSIWSADVYTNAVKISAATSTVWSVVYSNYVSHTVFTNTAYRLPFPSVTFSNLIASNAVTTVEVTTNTWPVYQKTVCATNAIVSGTCSGGVYSGAPASDTWIGATDHLIFTGTATGGFLRIVTE